MEVQPLPTLGMENPYHYRNKVQMPFGRSGDGKTYYGFYKEGSHVIVPISSCAIEDERTAPIIAAIASLMDKYGIAPYDEMAKSGYLRHAVVKTSYYYKEVMVILVTTLREFPHKKEFCADLLATCPTITTLVENINQTTGSKVLGDEVEVVSGTGYIKDDLCGLHFSLSAKSFFQTNPTMTEKLYATAMAAAKLTKDDVVFDAYSGIGTIGLIAAKDVAKVISVEILPEAVEDAKKNALANGISNFEVYADDASSFIYQLVKENTHINVLFMDPPRKGSDERFLKAVKTLKPERVIYVSCNPSSLARDVDFLGDTYKVSSLQPVDLFPQTCNVETVCALKLR
jgi:23S rRNA (uracil1939-C5)-methyltransferase